MTFGTTFARLTFAVVQPSVVDRLRAAPPNLHGGGDQFWGTHWGALGWLEANVRPGMATLETGAGASTIIFAAGGSSHEAVTPAEAEVERIRAECARLGVDVGGVAFRIGLSHEVLPQLDQHPLDIVLVGGADGFPYPILDWWLLAPRLAIGGHLLVDVAYVPTPGMLVDYMRSSPAWRLLEPVGYRTALAQKLADESPPFFWRGRRRSFRYLPLHRRAVATVRDAALTTRPGLAVVAWARGLLRPGSPR